MELRTTSALAPALSPGRGRIVRHSFEYLYNGIGPTLIRKSKTNKTISSPGGEEKVRAGVNADFNENVEEQN
jgi:hypothetical protein